MPKLVARAITDTEKQYLLDMDEHHLTNTDIVKLFNHWCDRETKTVHKPMFQPFDTVTLHKGDLKCVRAASIDTTVGLILFNKYLIDATGLHPYIEYINKSMNDHDLAELGDRVADLYLNDKIDNPTVNKFLTVRDTFLSMVYQAILPSLTENIMRVQPDIMKKADELCEKYKEQIDAGDLITMNKIQDELIKYAQDLLQDDAAMILYQSGSKPVFSNNYKVLSIMRGPIKNEVTGKYEFVTSNLVNGIHKEDIPAGANSILAGEYSTAIATASAGYISKRILFFMQGEVIGEQGSDCGSKATIEMVATKKLAMEYRYFVQGDKLLQLTPDNISKYEGRTLKFRTPMGCCRSGGPCNICAGDYAYKIGLRNIGLMTNKISGVLLNSLTKKKHDLSYKTSKMVITD